MGRVEQKYVENKTKDKAFKVPCIECNRKTKHKVLQFVDYSGCEWIERDYTIDWIDNFQIIQCQGCEAISFRHRSWFSEYEDYDWDGSTERLYPKKALSIVCPLQIFAILPPCLEEFIVKPQIVLMQRFSMNIVSW